MIYWGFYLSCVRRMPLKRWTSQTVSSKTYQVVRRIKRMVELALGSTLPRFLRLVTSQVMVSPCLMNCQNTHKNSWETVACLRRQRIFHVCCLPHIPRLVSLRQVATRSLFVAVTFTNDDLAAACLRDTNLGTWEGQQPIYLTLLPCWTSDFTEAAKAPPTISHPFI